MDTIDDENFHKIIKEIGMGPQNMAYQLALDTVNRWLIEHEYQLLKLTDSQLAIAKEIF